MRVFRDGYKEAWDVQLKEIEQRKEVDLQIYGNPS